MMASNYWNNHFYDSRFLKKKKVFKKSSNNVQPHVDSPMKYSNNCMFRTELSLFKMKNVFQIYSVKSCEK